MLSAITAYFIIPAYTLFFVRDTPWFSCNLSVIGSYVERKDAFVFLGILLGFYFVTALRKLLRLFPKHRTDSFLLYTALFLLLTAVIIPYLPAMLPFWSFLHICFAMAAALLLLLCLWRIIRKLSGCSPESAFLMTPYRMAFFSIITACIALFLCNGGIISTTLEIFFILSTVLLTQLLCRHAPACFSDAPLMPGSGSLPIR